ncbi:hypothetical protein [Paenibacillus sp. FSL H3-0333]
MNEFDLLLRMKRSYKNNDKLSWSERRDLKKRIDDTEEKLFGSLRFLWN